MQLPSSSTRETHLSPIIRRNVVCGSLLKRETEQQQPQVALVRADQALIPNGMPAGSLPAVTFRMGAHVNVNDPSQYPMLLGVLCTGIKCPPLPHVVISRWHILSKVSGIDPPLAVWRWSVRKVKI